MVHRLLRAVFACCLIGNLPTLTLAQETLPEVPGIFDPSQIPLNPSPCFEFYCFDGAGYDENTMVAVGATYHAGYVFGRNASGQWSFQQLLDLTPSGTTYAKPVAVIAGDIFLTALGASCETHVYRRTGNRWKLKQRIADCAAGKIAGDEGRVLLGGSPISLYTRTPSGKYVHTTDLTPGDAPDFGPNASMSMQGLTIAVGSPSANSSTGAVYVFQQWGKTWMKKRKIVPGPEVQAGGHFGAAVSVSGENIAIGAPDALPPDSPGYGVAYIYTGIGSLWYARQRIDNPNIDAGHGYHFATHVDLQGRRLLIGSDNFYPFGQGPFTFYYERPLWELQWLPTALLRAGRPLSVAISGGTAMVEAQGFNGGSFPQIYTLPPLSMTPPSWLPSFMKGDDGLDGEVTPP